MNGTTYSTQGVVLNPAVPTPGSTIKICYTGLLAKSGAENVFAHVGFGDCWEHAGDYAMKKTSEGFEVDVPVSYSSSLNLCFKDPANNWDNNNGCNYTFSIN